MFLFLWHEAIVSNVVSLAEGLAAVLIFPRTFFLFSLSLSLVAWERKSNFLPWGTLIFICISILKQNSASFVVLSLTATKTEGPLCVDVEVKKVVARRNWLVDIDEEYKSHLSVLSAVNTFHPCCWSGVLFMHHSLNFLQLGIIFMVVLMFFWSLGKGIRPNHDRLMSWLHL